MCVYCTYILFDYEENYSTFCLHQTCCWYNNKNRLSRYWMPLPIVPYVVQHLQKTNHIHLLTSAIMIMFNVSSFLSNTWRWLREQFACKFDKYAKRCIYRIAVRTRTIWLQAEPQLLEEAPVAGKEITSVPLKRSQERQVCSEVLHWQLCEYRDV